MKQFLAKNIKALRMNIGLSQREVAEQSNINQRHYQEIESGRVDIKQSTINEIAKTLKVPACYLLQDNLCENLLKEDILCKIEVLDHLPVGVLLFDREAKIVYGNSYFKKIFFYGEESDLATKDIYVWDLVYDENLRSIAKERFKIIKTTKPEVNPAAWTYRNSKNEPVEVVVVWDYIKNHRGQVTNYVATITEAGTLKKIFCG